MEDKENEVRIISPEEVRKRIDEILGRQKFLLRKAVRTDLFQFGFLVVSIVFGFFATFVDINLEGRILAHIGWLISLLALFLYGDFSTAYRAETRGITYGIKTILGVENEK